MRRRPVAGFVLLFLATALCLPVAAAAAETVLMQHRVDACTEGDGTVSLAISIHAVNGTPSPLQGLSLSLVPTAVQPVGSPAVVVGDLPGSGSADRSFVMTVPGSSCVGDFPLHALFWSGTYTDANGAAATLALHSRLAAGGGQ